MKKKVSQLIYYLKDNKGIAGVMVAILMMVFIALVALVVDTGYLYAIKNRYKNATDAAALAGAIYWYNNESDPDRKANAEAQARAIAEENHLPNHAVHNEDGSYDPNHNNGNYLTVTFGFWDAKNDYPDFEPDDGFVHPYNKATGRYDFCEEGSDDFVNNSFDINAVYVEERNGVDTFFMGMFTGSKLKHVRACSVAYVGEGGAEPDTGPLIWAGTDLIVKEETVFKNGQIHAEGDLILEEFCRTRDCAGGCTSECDQQDSEHQHYIHTDWCNNMVFENTVPTRGGKTQFRRWHTYYKKVQGDCKNKSDYHYFLCGESPGSDCDGHTCAPAGVGDLCNLSTTPSPSAWEGDFPYWDTANDCPDWAALKAAAIDQGTYYDENDGKTTTDEIFIAKDGYNHRYWYLGGDHTQPDGKPGVIWAGDFSEGGTKGGNNKITDVKSDGAGGFTKDGMEDATGVIFVSSVSPVDLVPCVALTSSYGCDDINSPTYAFGGPGKKQVSIYSKSLTHITGRFLLRGVNFYSEDEIHFGTTNLLTWAYHSTLDFHCPDCNETTIAQVKEEKLVRLRSKTIIGIHAWHDKDGNYWIRNAADKVFTLNSTFGVKEGSTPGVKLGM